MNIFSFRTLDNKEAREIAKSVCNENGWPFIEPVRVLPGFFSCTIVTNATKTGANVRIEYNRLTGKVSKNSFCPR